MPCYTQYHLNKIFCLYNGRANLFQFSLVCFCLSIIYWGISIINMLPSPFLLLKPIEQLLISTYFFTNARPSPFPSNFLVYPCSFLREGIEYLLLKIFNHIYQYNLRLRCISNKKPLLQSERYLTLMQDIFATLNFFFNKKSIVKKCRLWL